MAQLVERILGKDEVPSSTLGISTMKTKASLKREAFLFLPFSSSRSVWHRDRSGPARKPLSEWLLPAVRFACTRDSAANLGINCFIQNTKKLKQPSLMLLNTRYEALAAKFECVDTFEF